MNLTNPPHSEYPEPALAISSVGFHRPFGQNNGAIAPSNFSGVFFMPEGSPLVPLCSRRLGMSRYFQLAHLFA